MFDLFKKLLSTAPAEPVAEPKKPRAKKDKPAEDSTPTVKKPRAKKDKPAEDSTPTVKKPRAKKSQAPKMNPDKQLANERDEPYVSIVSMDINPENLHEGSFELDWNEKFVANLVRAGYMMKPDDTDADIVDRWFQNVCRHVVMETWEQEQAMNPQRFTRERDLGNGRKEIS